MRFPSLRNPKGFGDIFPILVIYIALIGVLMEFSDNNVIQITFVLGTIIMLSWGVWAVFSILDTEADEGEYFQPEDE